MYGGMYSVLIPQVYRPAGASNKGVKRNVLRKNAETLICYYPSSLSQAALHKFGRENMSR